MDFLTVFQLQYLYNVSVVFYCAASLQPTKIRCNAPRWYFLVSVVFYCAASIENDEYSAVVAHHAAAA